jgi:hypothetical protein
VGRNAFTSGRWTQRSKSLTIIRRKQTRGWIVLHGLRAKLFSDFSLVGHNLKVARIMPIQIGTCHCGAVKFSIDAEIEKLTTCDCSLCLKKNALMAKVHESQLSILEGENYLSLYQWNTRRAEHYFCSRCGIYTFHRKRVSPDYYGINVRCLDGFDPTIIPSRVTPGACMSITDSNARLEWPGPRVQDS